jgi:hypothetical protein
LSVYFGQQDEPLVVSQPDFDPEESDQEGEFGSFTTCMVAAGACGVAKKSFVAIIPAAASITIVKMTFGHQLFFFGGQQSPSHPQSFLSFWVVPPYFRFSSIDLMFD